MYFFLCVVKSWNIWEFCEHNNFLEDYHILKYLEGDRKTVLRVNNVAHTWKPLLNSFNTFFFNKNNSTEKIITGHYSLKVIVPLETGKAREGLTEMKMAINSLVLCDHWAFLVVKWALLNIPGSVQKLKIN